MNDTRLPSFCAHWVARAGTAQCALAGLCAGDERRGRAANRDER